MLTYHHKHSRSEKFETIQTPLNGSDLWVFGELLSDAEEDEVVDTYKLDRNILGDMQDSAELSRVEYNGSNAYVFLRSVRRTRKGSVITTPFLAVIGDRHFFLLSRFENLPPKSTIETSAVMHAQQNTALFLGTAAALLMQYDELIEYTDRVIRDTAQRLKTHEVTNQDFIHFVTVEDNLNEYEMNLSGMLVVMRRLRENGRSLFDSNDTEALDDIILHIEQLLVGVGTYSRRVGSIRNAHTTIANNNLNTRIKALTVLTVLITLPNVFFGMYGMNVALPFENEPWAYGVIVVFTLFLIMLVYIIARRLKVF